MGEWGCCDSSLSLPLIGMSPVPVPVPALHCNRGLLFVTGWPSITPRQGASRYARYEQVRREQRATVLVLFNLCDLSRDTLRAAGFIGRCNSATITWRGSGLLGWPPQSPRQPPLQSPPLRAALSEHTNDGSGLPVGREMEGSRNEQRVEVRDIRLSPHMFTGGRCYFLD